MNYNTEHHPIFITKQPLVPKRVLVVTPTIDPDALESDAVKSVKAQVGVENLEHLIVYDGVEPTKYRGITPKYIKILKLLENIGGNGYYGHRVYASIAHLVNHDAIFFLDADNWYKENHVRTCLDLLPGNDFVFSYRDIHDKDGNYISPDNFESIGEPPHSLVDTSTYCFDRRFLVAHGHEWHHQWGADRRFFAHAISVGASFTCTKQHTVCYRLNGNPNSPTAEFFRQGNENVRTK